MTVFSRLVPTITSAYALQTLLALIFVPQQNDKYYDLSGAVGWMSTTFISLYYPALKTKYWDGVPGPLPALSSFAPRQLLLSAAVGIWSLRLGSFLAVRAIKAGGDSRRAHDRIATWITLVGLPIWLVNTLPARLNPALGIRDYAAVGLYVGSLLFESIADRQKSAWRKAKDAKQHNEPFIASGLWSISRHPNYVGEVGIWTGIWALSTVSLQAPYFPAGTVVLAAASPLFTWFLLRKASSTTYLRDIILTRESSISRFLVFLP
ncbi:hypothetical protein NP233_g6315 [Leucocoprinus birnbaumii]|uniref:Steroid 5-alpha reductase C-terminal domain-containing protein n=1 Tax=Leucocoprinus birnbaumii TaxID=56174 RepID=A0AAD5VRD7_9AGAR|nr:hypothetical protein NP233_g6315 [Leucocoprinus birnbaumii]